MSALMMPMAFLSMSVAFVPPECRKNVCAVLHVFAHITRVRDGLDWFFPSASGRGCSYLALGSVLWYDLQFFGRPGC